MQCPVDGITLALAERHGVEIDYCPQCRGIWLDRGELDRIIDTAMDQATERSRHFDRDDDHDERHRHRDHDYGHDHDDGDERFDRHRGRPRRQRGGVLSTLTGMLGGDD